MGDVAAVAPLIYRRMSYLLIKRLLFVTGEAARISGKFSQRRIIGAVGVVTGSTLAGLEPGMDTFHIQRLGCLFVALEAKLWLLFLKDDGAYYAMAFMADLAVLLGHRRVNQLFLKSLNLFSMTIGTGLGSNSDCPGRR